MIASRLASTLAWFILGLVVKVRRWAGGLAGRTRRVDVIVYKVDRLGDWLLAAPSIEVVTAAAHARQETVVAWVGRESAQLRAWFPPDYGVEEFALEPRGTVAKLRRAWIVTGLLARYRARTLICFRHSPEPVRDFILEHAAVEEIHALSWRTMAGPAGEVPHEIHRHQAILAGLNLSPVDPQLLLPRLTVPTLAPSRTIVIAPFSSAPIKDWSNEAWSALAKALASKPFSLELWVGRDQVERAQNLAAAMVAASGAAPIAVRSGSLRELSAAITSAALVLSVDTFAAHLAVALDAPLVGLLGGGQYGDFAPWQRSARQQWVTHPLPCFNCNWVCTRTRSECIKDIPAQTVVRLIEQVLAAAPST